MKNWSRSGMIMILCLPLLLFQCFTFGQKNFFQIKTMKKGKDFAFPVLIDSLDINASRRINQFLQLAELSIVAGFSKQNIFNQCGFDPKTIYGGKVEIAFSVKRNDEKILAIKFKECSCGATCHNWITYDNFNSGNGELIQLQDLFTQEGYKLFKKKLLKRRLSAIKIAIFAMDTSVGENLSYLHFCIEDDDRLEQFYIRDSVIYVDSEHCLGKHEKMCGLNTIAKIRLSEFKDYLNDYGKCVFNLSSDTIANFHSFSFPQLFRGFIGERETIMAINFYGIEARIEYAFVKGGIGKFVTGEKFGSNIYVFEEDDKNRKTGQFKLKLDNNCITGYWTDMKTWKKHEVNLYKD